MLLYMDGFDYYTAAQATTRGWSAVFASMRAGRFGGQAASLGGATSSYITIPANATVVTGFAWYTPGGTFVSQMFSLRAGSTVVAALKWRGDIDGNNAPIYLHDSAGTLLASTAAILKNTWHYFELKVTVGASGAYELKVDGLTVATGTGNFGGSNITRVYYETTNSIDTRFDDFYVCDTTGGVNDDFLGDVRIATLLPSADGADTDWTPTYAPAFVVAGTNQGTGSTAATFTATLPTYQPGDVILLQVITSNALDHAVPVTATGWTKVCTDRDIQGWAFAGRVLMRQMTQTDYDTGVNSIILTAGGSFPASTTWGVRPVVYRYGDSSLDISGDTVMTTGTSITSSSLTTGGINRTLVAFYFSAYGTDRFTPTTIGVTERWDAADTGISGSMACEELIERTAGTYTVAGTKTFNDYSLLQTVVLKPNASAPHYLAVNDPTPDDDTSYLADSTPGDLDTFTMGPDIPAGSTVIAVQTNIYARKDDAATRQIAPVIRQGTTDYEGTTVSLAAAYDFYNEIWEQDPTSADWTAANVNGDEFGVDLIA